MKILILILAPFLSSAAWFSGEGTFSYPHDVAMYGYETAEPCVEDGGRFAGDGFCVFSSADEVKVVREGETYVVKVDTVSTNAHMCQFEGLGVWNDKGALVAHTEVNDWEGDKMVPATCEVTVTYIDGDTVSVSHNGKCASLCGANTDLAIERAKRK